MGSAQNDVGCIPRTFALNQLVCEMTGVALSKPICAHWTPMGHQARGVPINHSPNGFELTWQRNERDGQMSSYSKPTHASKQVLDHSTVVYNKRKMEAWYSDEKAEAACQKFMNRFPEGELDRDQFSINYMRYVRWYARRDVDAEDDLFLRMKASHAYSRECVDQLMRALAKNPTGPDWLFVDFINWFAENNFDLHNTFGNGWLDGVKRKRKAKGA